MSTNVRGIDESGGMVWRRFSIQCAAMVTAVFLAFHPALSAGFVWDDVAYLLPQKEARQLGLDSVVWAFSWSSGVAGHYQPLAWISWMVDFELAGGADPRQFHLSNLLLHAVHCCVLLALGRALLRLVNGRSDELVLFAVVLLYALHPLRVESVVWITERRDLLCGIFYSAAVCVHLRQRNREDATPASLVTFLLFVLAGLSKAWAISLPVVLWAIDVLVVPRKPAIVPATIAWVRLHWHFLLVSLAFVMIGLLMARGIGAMVPLSEHGVIGRLLQANYAWWLYLWMTLVPVGLAPHYGWGGVDFLSLRYLIALAGGIGVLLSAPWLTRQFPRLAAVIVCYTAIILPVLGLAQSGPQAYADRYTYLALLPWYFLMACLVAREAKKRPRFRHATLAIGMLFAVILSIATIRQSGYWRDDVSLWTRVIEVAPDDPVGWHSRAFHAAKRGDFALALADLEHVRSVTPHSAEPELGIARVQRLQGLREDALLTLERLAVRHPGNRDVLWHLARARRESGQLEAALSTIESLQSLTPEDPGVWVELAEIHRARGDEAAAVVSFGTAIMLDPRNPGHRLSRAELLVRAGRLTEAKLDIEEAMRLAPADWSEEAVATSWLNQINDALRGG